VDEEAPFEDEDLGGDEEETEPEGLNPSIDERDSNIDQDEGVDEGVDETGFFEAFEIGFEEDGDRYVLDEWIVLTNQASIDALNGIGFDVRDIEVLGQLDRILVRTVSPEGMDLATAETLILNAVPDAIVAHNHIYETDQARSYGRLPNTLLAVDSGALAGRPRIGVIDTAIDLTHPALASAAIQTQDFVSYGNAPRPLSHGTSVASILVGQDSEFAGLLPDAEIFAASVFFDTAQSGDMATTFGLVQAIDWMMESNVRVINFSLTGPANPILEEAIARARRVGIHAVAAIGNDGPVAPPLFPAAYDGVIGVTAVSHRKQVYRLAGHGSHVDFAAPGVLVTHARAGGSYTASSGTSLAAPFVSALLALLIDGGVSPDEAVALLQASAEDLGEEGFDTVFGHGFARMPPQPLQTSQ
jgi:hypothetical protein